MSHVPGSSALRTPRRRPRLSRTCEALEGRLLLSGGPADGEGEPPAIFRDPDLEQRLATPRLRRAARGYFQEPVPPGPSAPPVQGTIEGINFDQDGDDNNNGFYHIPPDPHGAAGPGHVVSVVNTSIEWHTKAGAQQNSQRLGTDFNAVGSFFQPLNPLNNLFDPKIVYDQYDGRFVVVALERQDTAFGDPTNTSRTLIAVSDDSDPNGTWSYQAIDSELFINGADRWLDYPGLAVDDNAIYITGNMFGYGVNDGAGSRLFIVNKNNLYAGGTGAVSVHDPSASVSLGFDLFTLQPTHMFGAAPGSTGAFLVSSGLADQAGNEFLSVIRVSNPLTAPAFTNTFVALGNVTSNFFPPGAPQMGSARTIDSGDGRLYNAVWRDNTLWAANTVAPPSGTDSGQATARWYKVAATSTLIGGAGPGGVGTTADQGNVGGEDIGAGTRTYYPAVNVDDDGNMGLGFGASGPNAFPGAYFTGRLANDPAGTVQSSGVVAAGISFYFRDFDSGANRWGDYSALALDPSDGMTFWAYNMYALARGTVFTNPPSLADEDGRWGTRWAKFSFGPVDPVAPRVLAVFADSTAWNANFRTGIQAAGLGSSALGFLVGAGAAQLDELSWANVNRFHVQFDEDVTVDMADLAVRGINVANYAVTNFAYNSTTFTASWTVGTNVNNDKILLDVNADAGGVSDVAGNRLDGEWSNGADTFPSGNGTAGGDFRYQLNVLAGDVNRSGNIVNSQDVQFVRLRQFTSPTEPGTPPNTYTIFHDVDGSAFINALDVQLTRLRQFNGLPDGTPTLVANSPAALFGTRVLAIVPAMDRLESNGE